MPKKQKSGLYRTKIKIGVDANGKDVVKWISGKTQKELEDAKREIIAKYIDGTALAADRLFGEYAIAWYRAVKEPRISASRRDAYKSLLNGAILPAFGDRNLRAITSLDIQGFMNQFAGKSSTTISTLNTILRGVFAQAYIDQIIDRNPAENVRLPEHSKTREKRVFTPEERARIEGVCQTHECGALLACLYYLGLRRGEALGLQWGDFDWPQRMVHIQRDIDFHSKEGIGELKTKSSNRFVPMPEPLVQILYPLRGMPAAFVFAAPGSEYKPYGRSRFDRSFGALMDACGLEGITAHYFRHNYITMCWENGVDTFLASKIVGHSDPSTTMHIYTHLTDERLKKSRAEIDKMFSEKVAQKLHKEK